MKAHLGFVVPCAILAACGSKREPDETTNYGPKQSAVVAAARTNGVNERALLAAAYVQSNFGAELDSVGRIPGATRISPFGLQSNSGAATAPDDLTANASAVAKSMRTRANESKPSQPFDWLLITAETIVGSRDDSPTTQTQTRIVLNELIAAYNNGFSTALPGGEIINVPPATEPVIAEKLDSIRRRLLDIAPQRTEFGTYLQGSLEAEEYGEKNLTAMPKVTLRWCAASAIVCFDHTRLAKDSSAHFVAYRSATGGLQFVQVHSIKKDLKWNGGTALNSVSIVLTGLAGNKTQWRPDWFAWNDYASLHKITRGVLRSFATFLPPGSMSANPIDHVRLESAPAASVIPPSTLGDPQADFTLPPFWDMKFFGDIIRIENLSQTNQLMPLAQPGITTVTDTRASFEFSAEKDVSQLTFFGDAQPTAQEPSGWELIRRSSLRENTRAYRFEEEFATRGISNNEFRSLRVIARNKLGEPVGMQIVTFRAMGLR
jgi:hypothetical protein